MVKSRRPTRKASAARRKTSSARKAKRPVKRAPREEKYVELKPIRVLIERAIERLSRADASDSIKITIERLQRCMLEFDAICDPKGKDGCGPDMTFPAP